MSFRNTNVLCVSYVKISNICFHRTIIDNIYSFKQQIVLTIVFLNAVLFADY